MATAIAGIAAAWFAAFSVYLFAAHQLPGYNPAFAKKVFSKPLVVGAVSLALVGLYLAWVSDPVTLRAFGLLGIPNTGIADPNVQMASLLITVTLAIPIAVAHRRLSELANRIDADKEQVRYFPWAGMLMAIVAAVFSTAAAILGFAST